MANWLSDFKITEATNPLDDTLGFGEYQGRTIRYLLISGHISYLKWMCKTDIGCAMRYYKPVADYLATTHCDPTQNEISW